jgi:FkbM family methyltransferase
MSLRSCIQTYFPKFLQRPIITAGRHLKRLLRTARRATRFGRTSYTKKIDGDGFSFLLVINPYRNGTVDETIATTGVWEPEVTRALEHILQKRIEGAFVDIGANIGYHTMAVATRFPERDIYAIEPLPWLAAQIRASVEINKLTHVTVHQTALSGATNETKPLLVRDENTGGSSFYAMDGLDLVSVSSRVTVPVTTLDSLRHHIGPIGVIKIDVEGHEIDVFAGASHTITFDHPIIIMECSPLFYRTLSADAGPVFISNLESWGYSFYDCQLAPFPLADWIKDPESTQKDIICLHQDWLKRVL